MDYVDYYNDRKFCDRCQGYVPYLHSIEESYCAVCGGKVRLFNDADWSAFNASLQERKPKGGRPRKEQQQPGQDKESA